MTERKDKPSPSEKPDWSTYKPQIIDLKREPMRSDFHYLKDHNLFDNPVYQKWQEPFTTNDGPLEQLNQPGDFILRALILANHLPWVFDTYLFSPEMGEVEEHKGVFKEDFLGGEDNPTNAVRFAYQQVMMEIPIETQTKLQQYKKNLASGMSHEEALKEMVSAKNMGHKIPNQEFIKVWKMTGKQRVEWLYDTFMKDVRKQTSFLIRLKAKLNGEFFEKKEGEFITDIIEILKPIRKLID